MTALFSCVAEDGPEWYAKVHNLLLSLRSFGGELAESAFVANMVRRADPAGVRPLEALGAEIRVVQPYDARTVYANKLRMLELADDHTFDVLVALDCDVVIMGDVSGFLPPDAIGVKVADIGVLDDAQWRALYESLGIPAPTERVRASTTGESMFPYFNSGVVTVPHATCRPLLASWTARLNQILEGYAAGRSPVPSQWRFHADQFSLACTLVGDGFAWRELPLSMNFPTHLDVAPHMLAGVAPPYVIHYHKRLDRRGFLVRSRAGVVDGELDRFNRRRAEVLSLPYAKLPGPPVQRVLRRAVSTGVGRLRRAMTARSG